MVANQHDLVIDHVSRLSHLLRGVQDVPCGAVQSFTHINLDIEMEIGTGKTYCDIVEESLVERWDRFPF